MFPLGGTPKAQVRAEAARRGLAVADKPDSHDVCFVADGDTRGFLARKLGDAPGQIVDQAGTVVGEHDGTFGFTVGQRRGMRIGTPARDGRPRYVLDIEPVTRTVTVGPAEEPGRHRDRRERPVWTGCAPPRRARDCLVQLSAHGEPHDCTAWKDGTLQSACTAPPAAWPRARPPSSTTATRCSAAHYQRHVGTAALVTGGQMRLNRSPSLPV